MGFVCLHYVKVETYGHGLHNINHVLGSDDTECTNNATVWKNDPSIKRCPTSDLIPPVIAATYMMLTNWLLLNIVIAMFRYNVYLFTSINYVLVM